MSSYRNVRNVDKVPFTERERNMLNHNIQFFSSNPKYIRLLLSFITGESEISLRLLEWFITHYCKEKNVYYKIHMFDRKNYVFFVYQEYMDQLKYYSKKYFDTYCRGTNIVYKYVNENGETQRFITSIRQLNFFQWIIRYRVFRYLNDNVAVIRQEMKEYEINKKNKVHRKEINTRSMPATNTWSNSLQLVTPQKTRHKRKSASIDLFVVHS